MVVGDMAKTNNPAGEAKAILSALDKTTKGISKQHEREIRELKKKLDKQEAGIKKANEAIKTISAENRQLKRDRANQSRAISGLKNSNSKTINRLQSELAEKREKDADERAKLKAQREAERAEAKAKAEQEKAQREAQKQAEKEIKEKERQAKSQAKEQERQKRIEQREEDKKKKEEAKKEKDRERQEQESFKKLAREKKEREKWEKENNPKYEKAWIQNKKDIEAFNRAAGLGRPTHILNGQNVPFSDETLLQNIKDFSEKNRDRFAGDGKVKLQGQKNRLDNEKAMRNATKGFNDINKQLVNTNRLLRMFGVALLALKILEWGKAKSDEAISDTRAGYKAGLNYNQSKMFDYISHSFGIDPQALKEDFATFRRDKDLIGEGKGIFEDNEALRNLLFGNLKYSLGFTPQQVLDTDSTRLLEMIMVSAYRKSKESPETAGIIEAQLNKANLGNVGSLVFNAVMSGMPLDKIIERGRIVVDTPLGREQSALELSTQWSELMGRLNAPTQKLAMDFEELSNKLLKFINGIPFLSTSQERVELQKKSYDEIKSGNFQGEATRQLINNNVGVLWRIDEAVFGGIEGFFTGESREDREHRMLIANFLSADPRDRDYKDKQLYLKGFLENMEKERALRLLHGSKGMVIFSGKNFSEMKQISANIDNLSKEIENGVITEVGIQRAMINKPKMQGSNVEFSYSQNRDMQTTIILQDKTQNGIKIEADNSSQVRMVTP